MSFALHAVQKRQSPHDAYSFPVPSMASDGREIARIGSLLAESTVATVTRVNVAPPSVDRRLSIDPVNASSPAYAPAIVTSVPFGCTAGCVPTSTPVARTGGDQVTPPSSLDWLTVMFLSSSVYCA